MIPKECKRLAEVDFPIAVVSNHSVWEKKNFPRSHPSTVHHWWARRPLGACRAMLLGLLLPDPCDKHCPAKFKARNGAAGAIEEDARLTALFLCTLQATNGQNGNGEENLDGDEQEPSRRGSEGFILVFDVLRRFAQALGIALPTWEGRIIETKKGVVRLLPVSERAKQLFGQDEVGTVVDWIEHDPGKDLQGVLFPELAEEHAPNIHGRGRRRKAIMEPSDMELQSEREATTLDRIHAAMLPPGGRAGKRAPGR